jgi:hypothetical protein
LDLVMAGQLAKPGGIDEVEARVRHEREALELLVGLGMEVLAQLVERGLLDELGDPPVVVGEHHAVLLGDLIGFPGHRRDRRDGPALLVRLEHRREVEVDDRVRREHEGRTGDVPVVHHPQRRVRATGRQHVVLDG